MDYSLPMVQWQEVGNRKEFDRFALIPGQVLTLHCEPSNAHNTNAIAVCQSGQRIGYVGRRAAEALHKQHGLMTSAVLDACVVRYVGMVRKEEAAEGHRLITHPDGIDILQSLGRYRAGVHALQVDPIGMVEGQLVVLRQLATRNSFPQLWSHLLWLLVPQGAFQTRMPEVCVVERAVSESDFRGDRFEDAKWMEQTLSNIQLTKSELGMTHSRVGEYAQSTVPLEGSSTEQLSALSADEEEVLLLPYTRTPAAFKEALLTGGSLREVRDSLQNSGLDCQLQPSGAKIFVWPEQYAAVVENVLQLSLPLKPSHVIIIESLMPALKSCTDTLRSKSNVRINRNNVRSLTKVPKISSISHPSEDMNPSDEASDEDWEAVLGVKRTFICTVRVLRNAGSVNQSTTETRSGVNPRRFGGVDPAPVASASQKDSFREAAQDDR